MIYAQLNLSVHIIKNIGKVRGRVSSVT